MISWGHTYLVRVGLLGHVGRFRSVDQYPVERGDRVICRTNRGLEVGEVLTQADSDAFDGSLVRAMTVEDELMLARLNKNRDSAYAACIRLLNQHGITASLVDVESLFDGQTLYFYFLGQMPAEVQPLINQLAEVYESQVRFRDFTAAVEAGCGPMCGTDQADGCGDACSSCPALSACQSK